MTIVCPCGTAKRVPPSQVARAAEHYCSNSCRATFKNRAKPRATQCRRGHLLTPQNTITLASGIRRCRKCNNDRRRWHGHGGSLSKALAWAKATCGPQVHLTDDEWERILRTEVFGAPHIVHHIVLLPDCSLEALANKQGCCGVDSLGHGVHPSEAWL